MKNQKSTGRHWDGMEIYEATEPLRVFALPSDAEGARQKDWGACVFAKACGRMFGSRRVAFFRRTAYVELPDRDGKRCVERFVVDKVMRDKIMEFDKTHVIPEGGFRLSVPNPSHRLDATTERKRKGSNAYKKKLEDSRARTKAASVKRKAAIAGQRIERRQGGAFPVMELEWRSGTGMVHFNSEKGVCAPKA